MDFSDNLEECRKAAQRIIPPDTCLKQLYPDPFRLWQNREKYGRVVWTVQALPAKMHIRSAAPARAACTQRKVRVFVPRVHGESNGKRFSKRSAAEYFRFCPCVGLCAGDHTGDPVFFHLQFCGRPDRRI